MKDIDEMLKCRALFLQSIAYLMGDNLVPSEEFSLLLESFMGNYLEDNYDKFNLIYYFTQDEDGNLAIAEDEDWDIKMDKYLGYFRDRDSKNISKLYDDIGDININKISRLAELFWEYVMILYDMNNSKIRN